MYRPSTGTPRKKNHFVQSVFFILLVATVSYILLQSPFFEVKTITVDGNRQLNEQEIKNFSGITLGTNIFKLNLAKAEERLSLVPLLKNTKLERVLPNKIAIHVVERKAVALLPVQNSFIKVDEDGVYLQKGNIASALPIITGLNVKVNGPGESIESKYLPIVLNTLEKLPRSLSIKLSEININEAGQVCIYTLEGVQGRMGLPKEIEYKGMVFQQVLNNLEKSGEEIQYVDLSNPKVPVVKYSKHQQEGQQ